MSSRGGHALRLAVVDRLELGELVGIGLDAGRRACASCRSRSIGGRPRPAAVVERGARGGDGAVDVGVGGVDEAADLAPGRGIDRPAIVLSPLDVDPFAVDEQRGVRGPAIRLPQPNTAAGGSAIRSSVSRKRSCHDPLNVFCSGVVSRVWLPGRRAPVRSNLAGSARPPRPAHRNPSSSRRSARSRRQRRAGPR